MSSSPLLLLKAPAEEDEESGVQTVFELEQNEESESPRAVSAKLPRSLSARGTVRKKSVVQSQKHIETSPLPVKGLAVDSSQAAPSTLVWTGRAPESDSFSDEDGVHPRILMQDVESEFIWYVFMSSPETAERVVHLANLAERKCIDMAAKYVHAGLAVPLSRNHVKRHPITRRVSRAMGFASNPSSLKWKSLTTDDERTSWTEWKRLHGFAALACAISGITLMLSRSYVRGAFYLRKSWSICVYALGNTGSIDEDVESLYRTPELKLVLAGFQIAMAIVPPWVLGFLRMTTSGLICDPRKGEAKLLELTRATNNADIGDYARLMLVGYMTFLSSHEYRSDRATSKKKSDGLLQEVLVQHPDWILFRWMRAQVNRRMGRVQDSITETYDIRTAIQGEMRRVSYRLTLDAVVLKFTQRDWTGCIELLLQLLVKNEETNGTVEEGDGHTPVFDRKVHAMMMLSASYGMRGNITSAVKWLETAEKLQDVRSRDDRSWQRRIRTLCYRPHKRVLAYEIAYIFGYMRWFDVDVVVPLRSGGKHEATAWMRETRADLKVMHSEATVSITYPDLPQVTAQDAAEELLVVSLMSGSAAATLGELDEAELHFKHVLDNAGTRSAREGTKVDPWHIPFALYELGSLDIRRGNMLAASGYLDRVVSLCYKRNFSFHHILASKCRGALRYIQDSFTVDPDDPNETVVPVQRRWSMLQRTHGAKLGMPFRRRRSMSKTLSFMEWNRHTDEMGEWVSSSSAGCMDDDGGFRGGMAESAAAQNPLIRTDVPRGGLFEDKHALRIHDIVTWRWAMDTHDVGFSVTFTPLVRRIIFEDDPLGPPDSPKRPREIVEEYRRVEPGDMVDGFYTSQQEGVLRLCWDNTHAKFTDKTLHYNVTVKSISKKSST